MNRSDVLSGDSLKTALIALAFFLVIIGSTGALVFTAVSRDMTRELDSQILETYDLLAEIHTSRGEQSLVNEFERTVSRVIAARTVIGLFDANGRRLAGDLPYMPVQSGFHEIVVDSPGLKAPATYRIYSGKVGSRTLAVGRDIWLLQRATANFLWAFLVVGAVSSALAFVVGYFSSRHVFTRLEAIARTMAAVSEGDTSIRLPVGAKPDQIDTISRRINVHLDRLTALTETTKNTISAIAHDLRTPLGRAYIAVQRMEEKDYDPQTRGFVSDIEKELLGLSAIVDAVLKISRIGAQNNSQDLRPVRMTDIVWEIVETFAPTLEERGQALVSEMAPNGQLALVNGDAQMLRQLLANLVQNASRYSPEGATVVVSVAVAAAGNVVLRVSDNGPGIAQSHRDNVLKPFFRLDASRSTAGTGLGLALVKAIATRHGANLSLDDNSPGLTVTVIFPLASPGGAQP